jgi:hypothetical protein
VVINLRVHWSVGQQDEGKVDEDGKADSKRSDPDDPFGATFQENVIDLRRKRAKLWQEQKTQVWAKPFSFDVDSGRLERC